MSAHCPIRLQLHAPASLRGCSPASSAEGLLPRCHCALPLQVAATADGFSVHVGHVLQLAAFCQAPAPVRSKVLSLFTPDPSLPASGRHYDLARRAAAAAAALSPGTPPFGACGELESGDLIRASLAWQFNSHAFRGRSVIFGTACRLNHSCDSNTTYFSRWAEGGAGLFVASRETPAGEEVTTSYLGYDDFLPAPARQQILRDSYCFSCDCPR